MIAVAQALWQLKSATEALATSDIDPEIQQHATIIVRWLVVAMGSDSPPLRSISYHTLFIFVLFFLV